MMTFLDLKLLQFLQKKNNAQNQSKNNLSIKKRNNHSSKHVHSISKSLKTEIVSLIGCLPIIIKRMKISKISQKLKTMEKL